MTDHLPPESLQLIKALESPACYPEDVQRVERLETHISWVLLTGTHAYKIKKPVDFGFVNFTTLERRKFFCEEELRLNGRLAPHMYLEVVAITGSAEHPQIGGEGEPLEYAVKMRQFSQEALLNHAIENGTLTAKHIDQLAKIIANFHNQIAIAQPEGETSHYGTKPSVLSAVWGNFRALLGQELDAAGQLQGESRLPSEFQASEDQLDELLEWTRTQANRLSQRFEDRRLGGAVRECHGDMHLGNMVLEEDQIVIFDGIDFNPDLRWIDVLSEVAFCLMDLADRNRPNFAHRLLNAYLERTGDYSGLDVLPFYLTYRALVRAKVAHLGWQQHDEEEHELKQSLAQQRQEYLDLASQYTKPHSPKLLITHGLSGSGKSVGTQPLIETLGAIRVRSDVERKRLAGLDPLQKSDSQINSDLYSTTSTEATYHRLAQAAKHIIEAGYTAVVDATFLKAEQRTQMRNLAKQLNVPFHILDFQASEAQLRERITKRLKVGADPSEANLQVLDSQIENREAFSPDEQAFVIPIDTEEANAPAHLAESLK